MYRLILILTLLFLVASRTADAGTISGLSSDLNLDSMSTTIPNDDPVDARTVILATAGGFSTVAVSVASDASSNAVAMAFDQGIAADEFSGRISVLNYGLPPKPEFEGLIKPPIKLSLINSSGFDLV